MLNDTIAAVATPPGTGGIGIIRVSGDAAIAVCEKVFFPKYGGALSGMKGYTARLGDLRDRDGSLIDESIALVFRGPRSYTGEDEVELMCHGGALACEMTLRAVLDAGASPAGPGEFTRRALLNGRITLTEAEAVCDLIGAASKQGQQAAAALAKGALYEKTQAIKAELLSVSAHLSAVIDFPEEDVEPLDGPMLREALSHAAAELRALVDSYETGANVLRGVNTVIVGSPNVGKSTLLNLLAGTEKALVTPVAGTTRDIVEQQVRLGGTVLLLADTAGIRESDDLVEQMGINRALERLEQASLVLAVFDGSRPLNEEDKELVSRLADRSVVAVINKSDLETVIEEDVLREAFQNIVTVSAKDRGSLPRLDAAVAKALRTDTLDPNSALLANERQRDCAVEALSAVEEALSLCAGDLIDVVYARVAGAVEALARLSGEDVTEAVLDEVFSRFCVGK